MVAHLTQRQGPQVVDTRYIIAKYFYRLLWATPCLLKNICTLLVFRGSWNCPLVGWLVGWFNSRCCRRRLCLSMAPQLSIRIDFLAHVQLLMYTALDGGRLNGMVGVSNREKSRPCCILFGSIVYSLLGCSPLEEEKERSQLEEGGGWRATVDEEGITQSSAQLKCN